MYGAASVGRRDGFDSEDETEIDRRSIVIGDFIDLLTGIVDISKQCSILSGGVDLSLGRMPLKYFNMVITKHIDVIDELYETINTFKKKNKLIITELKEEEKEKRERRESVKQRRRKKKRQNQREEKLDLSSLI
ncbi:hypothetical protein KM1_334720 [Entamoeba histolytica HM-3:IMSS]|uniref:Uncharacterized protein n=4 Tax=Entamoeba histolytica TaxID=5759 RepID=C4M9P7_ENTH1|nr:hypothetical protein EHI_095440 [Entamoeba histolytica HM-1:IMSS]EAL43835.1 hypothetical protein EHI_095440 [Entamoeba histolytica HM-1:IMSS]EMD43536.1 Hypothetical protein EHI5A_245210 [Entamoeba histolytica KU27]EMS17444.1 hypothetical protein KM1_334720 [Entamoeba histolytica HM-3:IMSS]GAT98412.1 hypothetical protein CL6EHI_095440 [Entamoeba histolytica]|eukprot:XP_649221.1 hypothetical protein EHI_095440 [Entamoeba histolytica HM-1:IMSS]